MKAARVGRAGRLAPGREAPAGRDAGAGGRPTGSDTRRRALLIEDDGDIAEAIAYQLEKLGLQVRVARTGEEGLEARMIRRQPATAHVPIIIVSARADEVDRVLGLEMGADNYVVKPFSLKELAARAKAALRRAGGAGEAPLGYRDEDWEIEFDAYVVRYKGEEIRLTHKECRDRVPLRQVASRERQGRRPAAAEGTLPVARLCYSGLAGSCR